MIVRKDEALLVGAVNAALKAGQAVMDIYDSEQIEVAHKQDDSPLTLADKASHDVLAHSLSLLSDDAVLSEEGKDIAWSVRKDWSRYWLIDPLDGTKEFIKRNGEFTVNVALIDQGVPVLGVVYAPAKGSLYFGSADFGAYCMEICGTQEQFVDLASLMSTSRRLQVSASPQGEDAIWRLVGSRSHQSEAFQGFANQFPKAEIVAMGSSLKLCLVAEGAADLYPRLGLTSEWDTAAAQAVVEAAGGQVINLETGQALRYNQKEALLNPFFIVCAERSEAWCLPVAQSS